MTVKKPKIQISKSKAKPKAKKKPAVVNKVKEEVKVESAPTICRSCNALPMGSVELVGLLLVLVFSLSAVLLTSVYTMEHQAAKIESLESHLKI